MKTRVLIGLASLLLGTATIVSLSGCAGYGTHRSTGEYIDDASLTTRVKTALIKDPIAKARHVNVDTYRGVVQLNGFVDSDQERMRAVDVARAVPGVVAVQDHLTVKGAVVAPIR